MSIMDFIENQLSDDTIRNVSGQIGEDESKTRMAIRTAVPTILAALGKQASTGDGASRFASMLQSFDSSKYGSLTNISRGQPGSVPEQGSSMLNLLGGGDVVSSIVSAISRFTNMTAGSVQKLLSLAMPMVVGAIANQFRGKAVTPQALSGFFSGQMPEITRALPSGFSLANIPGFSRPAAAIHNTADTVKSAAARASQPRDYADDFRREPVGAAPASAARWAVPLVALGLVALLAWTLFDRATADRPAPVTTTTPAVRETMPPATTAPPTTTAQQRETAHPGATVAPTGRDTILTGYNPEVAEIANKLSAAYTEANSIMAGITDVDSAQAAVPELTQVNEQIESLSERWEMLPETSRTTVHSVTTRELPKFQQEMDRVLGIPGAGDVLRPVLDDTATKLSSFKK